jgi:DNA-binding transcriptional LysR family regulator
MRSLIAFEATARLGSMTAAAEEERGTQPAVSQRIRTLEETLGLPLFDRQGGRLTLTAQGERFYQEIRHGLTDIRAACDRVVEASRNPSPSIVVAAGSGFTHLWLLPHVPALKRAFPDRTFRLLPVDRPDDPELQAADIAIRFGPHAPREPARLVTSEAVFPVCTPEYADRHGLSEALASADLERVTLLHQDSRDPRWLNWAQWCRHAGLEPAPREDVFAYHNYALLLNAALAGEGVGLGWTPLVEDYLDSGQLIALGPRVTRRDHGYWLRTKHHRSAVIDPVGDWLIEAANRRSA